MKNILVAVTLATMAAGLIVTSGCAVVRSQESVGAYIDDAGITTAVKARFVEDKTVDASAIRVETLKGTVQLSGFAKSQAEKTQAEVIARKVNGVVAVQNSISVRP